MLIFTFKTVNKNKKLLKLIVYLKNMGNKYYLCAVFIGVFDAIGRNILREKSQR